MAQPAERVFYSYSSRDERLRLELETHLAVLRREGAIETWSFRAILPGEQWNEGIRAELDEASLILLLVSADFLQSRYIWDVEVSRALDRHKRGEAAVIPVILRDCDWRATELSDLQALPAGGKPVTAFRRRDSAWSDVVAGVRRQISERRERRAMTERRSVSVTAPRQRDVLSEHRPRILAIEDDPEVVSLYVSYLQKHGYAIDVARNGKEGIEMYEKNERYDVILLDLNMPDYPGEYWLEWYRARTHQHTPVVILSAKGNILTLTRGSRLTTALTKPFHMEELQELLDILIGPRRHDHLSSREGLNES